MTAANGRTDRKHRPLERPVVLSTLERLENRTLLSVTHFIAVSIHSFGDGGSTANSAAPVFTVTRANPSFNSWGNKPNAPQAPPNTWNSGGETFKASSDATNGGNSTGAATSDVVAYQQSGGSWAFHGSGRAFHDWSDANGSNFPGGDNDSAGDANGARAYFLTQQGSDAGATVMLQPAYVILGGPMTFNAAFAAGQDHPTAELSPMTAAATAPVQSGDIVAANPKVSKAILQADASAITTSQPQRNDATLAQSFTLASISSPITSVTPHTRVENNLVVGTWQTAMSDFSKAPIAANLDWEIAVATNAVSAGASATFVQNLVISDASALAHVANTLALRLFDEDTMIWRETAAFIGTAVLVGSYVARNRLQTEDPPRKKQPMRKKHLCVGE